MDAIKADAVKMELLHNVIDFLSFTKKTMVLLKELEFNDDSPSDDLKNEIMKEGINVIDVLIEELNDNADSIDADDLVSIKNRKSALEVEDMLVKLCDKFVGRRSTHKLFAAMSSIELIMRNVDDSMKKFTAEYNITTKEDSNGEEE